MKFNFKKITAIATSLLVTGMTMGVAAAANFPAPFSDGTSAASGIVYGANAASTDVAAVTNINTYLAGKVQKTTSGEVTGESVKFEKSSTLFHVGQGVLDVVSASITDDSPGSGLPTLLADGKYIDDDNDEFDYTQKVSMGNISLTMWEDNDYKDNVPTLAFKVANNEHVLNYTLEMTDEPLWADLATTDLTILGKPYYVLSKTTNTTLNLLDSAATTTLEEGESATLTVAGTSYEVTCDFVGSSTARFTVNGDASNALAAGDTQKIAGAYIGVKSIDSQQYAEGVKRVEFAVGMGKLKLVSGSDIELNDNSVSDMKVFFTNSAEKLQKVVIQWDADGDHFIAEDQELLMPGFGALKLTYSGTTFPKEETVQVKSSDTNVVTLENFPLKDSVEDIDILFGNSSNIIGIGGDNSSKILRTSNHSVLKFDRDTDAYFVVSYTDGGSNAESYLMRVGDFKEENSVNKSTFYYKKDNAWTAVKADAKPADVVSLGNAEITISYIHKDNSIVNFTAGTGVKFNTLYSKEGLKVYLPWTNESYLAGYTQGGCVEPAQTYLGCVNISAGTSFGATTYNLEFEEEDKNDNIGEGDTVNLTINFNSASTKEIEVGDVVGEDPTFTEIESTDIYRSMIYSALATELLWDKPSSGQKSIKLMYHGEESYGNLYLTAPDASVGSAGNMIFKDSEKSSWQDRNVVLVGGSCINSATAEKLGGALCDTAFTAATGVSAGEFMIASYDGFATGKVALVVAGYEAADTSKAADMLLDASQTIDTTAGKTYKGTTAMEEGSVLTEA